MQRKALAIAALTGLALTGIVRAGSEGAQQMNGEQKILHALNRLTFGARPSDPDAVKQIGLARWIDQQLHPATIAENPVLEAKLQPLDTLRMPADEMLRRYPSQQMVKAMVSGRLPLPSDPQTRALVEAEIARYKNRKQDGATADAAGADAQQPPARAQMLDLMNDAGVTPEERRALRQGTQQQRAEALASLPPEVQRRFEVLNARGQVADRDLVEGKLLRTIYSNRQLEEVLTDFWYNHFNVYLNKGADRSLVTSYERDAIRPHVLGQFEDLLIATAESPAMLFYLDNWQSVGPDAGARPGQKRRQGLNENYGRELMELHTLGVDGGYTQKDVTEVARCFTGWTIVQPQRGGAFVFNPRMHDRGEKHVLGMTIPAGGGVGDGMKVLHLLAHHPSTAHFISRSLAIRFVSDNPPPALVEKMAQTFLSTDGDLRAVMRTMIDAPEFWDAGNFRSKVKSPLEMLVSAVRAVQGEVMTALPMANLMNQLGQPLYRKQEPTGYSNISAEWMNSASLLARMNFANSLAENKVAGVRVDEAQFERGSDSIECAILLTAPSEAARAAIEAGQAGSNGALVAGLTMGSPDFQRR